MDLREEEGRTTIQRPLTIFDPPRGLAKFLLVFIRGGYIRLGPTNEEGEQGR